MPAPQNFQIQFSTEVTPTTWTTLTNVQSINAQIGRQSFMDPFQPSQLTFTMRYPTGFASPISALVTNTWIRMNRIGGTYEMWRGKIADVSVEYGKPYTGGTGVQDYVTVRCEGAMALWGRLYGDDFAVASADAAYTLAIASSETGLPVGTTYVAYAPETPWLAASTVSSSWLDWLNTYATTLSATLKDGAGGLGVYGKDFYGTLPVFFSDVANNATNQVYEDIEFTSQVENFFTKIIVKPNTFAEQIVSTGSAPFRTLTLDTFSYTTGQAQDLANFYLTMYQTPRVTVSKIVCRSEAQNTWALDLGYGWWDILGYRSKVTFRGQTVFVTILGASMQASPAGSTFTYHVVDSTFFPWFVLDDPVYGVLDTNRLSW